MTLALPHSGSAATAYYRTFGDKAIVPWMMDALRPGMSVIDVGAHVGVYSLPAARLVGSTGCVHAIDPQATALRLLEHNAMLNELSNVRTHCLALGERNGDIGLLLDKKSMGAFTACIDEDDVVVVPETTLDTFVERVRLSCVYV